MARWKKGERTVQFLISRGRLETVEAEDLAQSADALIARAALRVEATAAAALKAGDVEGAYVAAYDAYRIAAESLLVRQGLRATGFADTGSPSRTPRAPGHVARVSALRRRGSVEGGRVGGGTAVERRGGDVVVGPHHGAGQGIGHPRLALPDRAGDV